MKIWCPNNKRSPLSTLWRKNRPKPYQYGPTTAISRIFRKAYQNRLCRPSQYFVEPPGNGKARNQALKPRKNRNGRTHQRYLPHYTHGHTSWPGTTPSHHATGYWMFSTTNQRTNGKVPSTPAAQTRKTASHRELQGPGHARSRGILP